MKKLLPLLVWLLWPLGAFAQSCPSPNPNLLGPGHFVDGCPLPATGLNLTAPTNNPNFTANINLSGPIFSTGLSAGTVISGGWVGEAADGHLVLGTPAGGGGGSGTVTSVGLTLPSLFSVSGSPVTSSGTLAATFASQTQNLVLASPNGSSGAPTFRGLVAGDLPASGVTAGSYTNANITVDTFGRVTVAANGSGAGGGTVTSVGLSLPGIFSVTGSPVTGSGTLTAAFASQTANQFLASPNGSSGALAVRTLAAGDMPATVEQTNVNKTDTAQNTWLGPNGTVTCPLTFGSTISPVMAACAASGSDGVEMEAVTLTGNAKLAFPTSIPTGTVQFVTFRFVQDSTGSRTVTPAPGYSPPAWQLSTRPGAVDQITCLVDQPNSYASCGGVQRDVGGVDPTNITGLGTLQLYGDVSDPTTLYSGAACSGALAGGGGTVGSIRDKGALGSCGVVTGTMTLTLDSNGRWYLAPSASSYITWSTGTGANPNTLAQNITYLITMAGIEYGATSSVAQSALFMTNNSTGQRFGCGLDLAASGGLFTEGNIADTGSPTTLQTGSDTNATGAPLVQDCNWQPTLGKIWLGFNNGSAISTTFTSGNTANTASAHGPYTGYDGFEYLSAGSRIYFIAVWTGANATGTAQTAIQSWGCTKMGISC